jgi:predicted RNA binding protein YcfA (HicA-like mRNA interferase family)
VSQLPAVSGKQLIKILESRGWYVKRIRGSHHILRHPTIPDALPVPVHGSSPIKRGTLGHRRDQPRRVSEAPLTRKRAGPPGGDAAQPDRWGSMTK